ncbi:hypothetical protein ACIXMM_08020 [Bacteroides fragilis]
MRELNFPGVSADSLLSEEDALEAYRYAIEHCRRKPKGWSKWKGLLMGVDHLASATEEFKERIPTLFSIPDVGFTIVNIPCIHYRRYCQRLIRSTHLLKLPPVRVKLIFY